MFRKFLICLLYFCFFYYYIDLYAIDRLHGDFK